MGARQIDKAVQRAAADFERSIEQGFSLDDRKTFAEYAAYVIDLKERTGAKPKTIESYKMLSTRTNQAIGHLAVQDIRPHHLNQFYHNLTEAGIRNDKDRAAPKPDFCQQLKEHGFSMAKAAKLAGVAEATVNAAGRGDNILLSKAEQICTATKIPFDSLFTLEKGDNTLSTTTVLAYHRFIHAVLAQASKEMLVPYNAADKATPPKKEKSEVGTFQTSELIAIRKAAEKEPKKWQMAILPGAGVVRLSA